MQQQITFLDMPYGKMFREHSLPQERECQKEKTSDVFLRSSSKSTSRQPRCLRLIKGDGPTPMLSWVTDGAWLTEYSMLNGGYHSVGRESTLSQVLEMNAPEKYWLSSRACEGILRRASKRGKQLPEMLQTALEQQIERLS